MKDLTQVEEVNIFSRELVQIYTDFQSTEYLSLTKRQRESILQRVIDFNAYQKKSEIKNSVVNTTAIYKKYKADNSLTEPNRPFPTQNQGNVPNEETSEIIGYHLFFVKLFLIEDVNEIKNFYQSQYL